MFFENGAIGRSKILRDARPRVLTTYQALAIPKLSVSGSLIGRLELGLALASWVSSLAVKAAKVQIATVETRMNVAVMCELLILM